MEDNDHHKPTADNDSMLSLPMSPQKRHREEPGYTFFWFPRRKRQRQNEDEMNLSLTQEAALSTNTTASTTMSHPSNSTTIVSWTAFLWNQMSSSPTADRVGKESEPHSLNAMDLSLPPVSHMRESHSATDPSTELTANDANIERSLSRNQDGNLSRIILDEDCAWKDTQPDALRRTTKRARKKAVVVFLLMMLAVLGFSIIGFRFIWPLTPFRGWTLTGKMMDDSQCWMDQMPEGGSLSLNQDSSCQRQPIQPQLFSKVLASFNSARVNAQSVSGRIYYRLVQHVILTPSRTLFHGGKAVIDAICEVATTTLQIACSYPFQSLSALLILLVARVYNFVASKRLEYC